MNLNPFTYSYLKYKPYVYIMEWILKNNMLYGKNKFKS